MEYKVKITPQDFTVDNVIDKQAVDLELEKLKAQLKVENQYVVQDLTKESVIKVLMLKGEPGGGGGGTANYNELTNKPRINNVVLIGNHSLEDFIDDFLLIDCGTSTRVI